MIILTFLVLIPVLGLALMALLSIPVILSARERAEAERLKKAREQAKLEVDQLRKKRLERDLGVVENRMHLIATQEALAALRIEKLRRELDMKHEPFTPNEDYRP